VEGETSLSFWNFKVQGFGSLEGEISRHSRGENLKQEGGDTWKDTTLLSSL
jgi:hypothetical protein